MNSKSIQEHLTWWFRHALWLILVVAATARFFNLSQKMYWVDEVASSLRIAGMTSDNLQTSLKSVNNEEITASRVRSIVQPHGHSSASAVIHSLAVEDAQHPPGVPIMQYFWAKLFGAEPGILRLLSAIFSVCSIVAIFWLTLELTRNQFAAQTSALLFALSPLQLIYAQQVREYAAWTFSITFTSALFLRSVRTDRLVLWICYALSLALALYIYPTSIFFIFAHGLFLFVQHQNRKRVQIRYILSTGIALVLFMPWAIVIGRTVGKVVHSNNFSGVSVSYIEYVQMFLLNLGRNFFDWGTWSVWDRPIPLDMVVFPTALGIIIAVGSIVHVAKKPGQMQKRFLLLLLILPLVAWLAPDIIFGGKRSLVPRYLMPCWVSIYICLGIQISDWVESRHYRIALGVLTAFIVLGASSFSKYFSSSNWWTTRPPKVALDLKDLGTLPKDTVILTTADVGWSLMSVVYSLPESTSLWLIGDNDPAIFSATFKGEHLLIFGLSGEVIRILDQNYQIRPFGISGKFLWADRKR